MRNVGLAAIALVGMAGLFPAGAAAATGTEPPGPVIRYTVAPNPPVDAALWLPVTPALTLWADGRYIATDPVLRRGDWLLPLLVEGHLRAGAAPDLVGRAAAAGLLSDGGDYGEMLDYGPHASMTELVFRDGEAEWVHVAFALDLGGGETGARGALADFITELDSLPTSSAAEPAAWVPEAIAIRAVPIAPGDSDGAAVDWPTSGPPLGDGPDCQIVRDETSNDVMRDALASSRFVDGGREWRLAARPELPGLAAC